MENICLEPVMSALMFSNSVNQKVLGELLQQLDPNLRLYQALRGINYLEVQTSS